ncbi:uncharacterized protein LDX57_005659 [Aspergillus melleus]|uniref:uncharacterized protein n=1 Tax=Aspergillus melleus TaxID=138277 RepID=UPI001E8CCA0E|nr:uncharacterized protein LDX57_005659 [Aspergillus melleus]KAH8427953.1 hypothetical protein LDX57_005659 [Aspergillus melleus]
MVESKEHQSRRRAVEAVADTISNLREAQYAHKDLDHLPIQILPMPLSNDGDPLFQSEYFQPCRKLLQDPSEEIEYPAHNPHHPLSTPMSEASDIWQFLTNYLDDAMHQGWVGKFDSPRHVNGDDDQITRGEILSICRIMIRCLRAKSYLAYKVIPVLLISFMGPRHARILLAHHNGTDLVVRQSKLLDFREKNVPAFKILLRWWCSSGTGDTIIG